MMAKGNLADILFPNKCLICEQLLEKESFYICPQCQAQVEDHPKAKRKISFVAGWTALWYYTSGVRDSLLRYKFQNHFNHGTIYGRLLAMKLLNQPEKYDLVSWVPVSTLRRWQRGYDQAELIAVSLAQELQLPLIPVLRKSRHTKRQSSLPDVAHRRANILGAYKARNPKRFQGKTILLIDDIITTGATVSECAKTLLVAGAKEVYCAAVAAPNDNKKQR